MANAVEEHDSVFHWEIKNPIVPCRTFEAVFVHGSKTPLHWKVVLVPAFRTSIGMGFLGSLEYLYGEGSPDTHVHSDRFEIKVWANGGQVLDEKVSHFTFEILNHYDFEFPFPLQLGHCHQHATVRDHMKVVVNLSLQRPNMENREGDRIDHLIFYSRNLRDLLEESWGSLYSDLKLKSWDEPSSPFQVHTSILGVRWDNFFMEHPYEENIDGTVETGISHDVLREILVYMYSGEYFEEVARDERLTTELWKVVDKYGLYDIYNMYVQVNSVQKRFDFYHCIKSSRSFDVSARRFQRLRCNMNSGTDYEFGVELRIYLGHTNSFSYSLLSRSRHNLNALVILEFARFIPQEGPRRAMAFRGFHAEDYEIRSNGRVESGSRLLNAFQSIIMITLCLSDGTEVVAIEGDKPNVQKLEDQFYLLSEHVSILLPHRHEVGDLQIRCPILDLAEYTDDDYEIHHVHKEIFVARVPKWKAALKDIPEEVTLQHAIPDVVRCDVLSSPFKSVIYTIYTGKSVDIPGQFLGSVYLFARIGDLKLFDHNYLKSLYKHICNLRNRST